MTMNSTPKPSSETPHADVIALTPLRADVTRALQRRGKKLLEAADLAAQMAQLSPLEAYLTIKELGLDEATPLLKHATPEQLQACIDLDCWEGDAFAPQELDAYLAPFAAESEQALFAAFVRFDEELQAMYLTELLDIYDVRSETVPERVDEAPYHTPDDLFAVCRKSGADGSPPLELEIEPPVLLAALYKHDADTARRLLFAAKWELLSGLQEEALHFRQGRLQDAGFLPRDVAMRLFAPPPQTPPALLAPGAVSQSLPAIFAGVLQGQSLWVRTLSLVQDAALLEALEAQLVSLTNRLVVCLGTSPRDLSGLTRVARTVRDTISLGLQVLLRRDGKDASEAQALSLVEAWPPLHLFQWGMQGLRPLQAQAQTLAKRSHVAAFLVAPREPEAADAKNQAFLRALCQRLPQRAGVSEDVRDIEPFVEMAQVEAAQARLAQLDNAFR